MQNSNLKVSIITPAYNVEKYIEQTIQSVLAQTFSNWELLITDDCSKDNTIEVIRKYAEKDNRIKLLRNKENKGPAETRNNSLANATGRFIAFLDSDDLWIQEKLDLQLKFMIENNYYFSFTEFRRFNDIQLGHCIPIPAVVTYNQLLKNTSIATSTVMLDTNSIAAPIKMKKVYYDDFVLWLNILKTGIEAYGLQKDLMRYRVLKNSVSRNKINSAKQVWLTYRCIENKNFISSSWFFGHWIFNSLLKYRSF